MASVVHSKLLYTAPVWDNALQNHAIQRNCSQRGYLSRHGSFNAYLRRFKKRDEKTCCYCDFPVDTAEHALFVCAKWGVAREALGQAVVSGLTSDTMFPLMLQSERIWTFIESFVTLVMKTRAKQRVGPVEIILGPAPAVLRPGWTWLSASIG